MRIPLLNTFVLFHLLISRGFIWILKLWPGTRDKKPLLQRGCPGEAQQKATVSPGPVLGPQRPCVTANTLSYSRCLGTDGKRLRGEEIHLLLAQLADIQGTTFSSISARRRDAGAEATARCQPEKTRQSAAEELLLPSRRADRAGKVQRLLAAETQRIKINSWAHDGSVVWDQGLWQAPAGVPGAGGFPLGKENTNLATEMAKPHEGGFLGLYFWEDGMG